MEVVEPPDASPAVMVEEDEVRFVLLLTMLVGTLEELFNEAVEVVVTQ